MFVWIKYLRMKRRKSNEIFELKISLYGFRVSRMFLNLASLKKSYRFRIAVESVKIGFKKNLFSLQEFQAWKIIQSFPCLSISISIITSQHS